MIKHKILLPDGTVLTSGDASTDAIRSVALTEQVNDETDICPGAACAACAEIELWAPRNGLTIAQDNEFTLVRIDAERGAQTPVGVFLAEKPVKPSANVIKVTAYDRMTLELRYPFMLGNTTIYGLTFVEAGNAWQNTRDFNPFDMKRSAGVGVRIYLPMVGLMGIDWAYGFDKVWGTKGGSQFHFILGQEF